MNCKNVELSKYTDIIKKGDMLEQSRQFNMCINSLNPDSTALCGGGVSPNCLLSKVLSRHSEALAEESQGFNTPCRPEFISGPYQFSIGLQAGKMLNQVQHDIIFLSLRRGIKGEVTS